MKLNRKWAWAGLLIGALATGCSVSVDAEPVGVEIPDDVFLPVQTDTLPGNPGTSPDEPDSNTTSHPIFLIRDGLLVEIVRSLPAPVFLEAPLNNLLAGPTNLEASQGLVSAIPAGSEVVDVQLLRNNVISLHLNEVFFAVEGEQRIRATAQLVLTASALAANTQGVLFFLDGRPQSLPDGSGTIAQAEDGSQPRVLRAEDFANLLDENTSDDPASGETETPRSSEA